MGYATFAAAVVSATIAFTSAVQAADWRTDIPKIVFGPVTSEDLDTKMQRWTPMAEYLEEKLGVEVELRHATDYIGIVQAMEVGEVHLAWFGPGPYATAWDVLEGDLQPLAMTVGKNGGKGYYSVVVTPAESDVKTLEDVKGGKIAFSDPNSTSGYLVPSFYLRREGKLEDHFGEIGFSGGHENSILSVLRGDYDVAATGMATEEDSFWGRMERAGTIPEDSIRVIWKSPLIANPAFVTRESLPEELKAAFLEALLDFPVADAARFETVSNGGWSGTHEVEHADYADFIEMRKANLKSRKTN